jgi:hypothetical protein
MEQEEGWFAWKYGHRKPRQALRFRHSRSAPAAFLTVLHPFRGSRAPEVAARWGETFQVGAARAECQVVVDGRDWKIGRDLGTGEAWCR